MARASRSATSRSGSKDAFALAHPQTVVFRRARKPAERPFEVAFAVDCSVDALDLAGPNGKMPSERATRSRVGVRTTAAAALLLAAGILAARTVSKLNVPGHPDVERWGLADFRDNAYYPVVALLHGDNPYDAATYTRRYPVGNPFPPYAPLTLAVHGPLAMLPLEWAELVYWLITALLAFPLAGLALAACGARRDAAILTLMAAVVLLSRPGHWNLVLGQSAMLLAVATFGALHCLRTQPTVSGLLLVVASIKPSFGAPLAVLMTAMGGGRVVLRAAVVAVLVSLVVAVPLAGAAGGVHALAASMFATASDFAAKVDVRPTGDGFRVDLIGLVGRLRGREAGLGGELLMSAGILALGVVAVQWVRRSQRDEAHLAVSVACLTVLMCMYHNAYEALLLVLPVTAALTARRFRPWASHPAMHGVLVVCLAVPFVNYLASDTALGILGVARGTGLWLAIMSVNGVALVLAFAILVVAAWLAGDARVPALRGHAGG